MSNKTKKEAATALAKLQTQLREDEVGLELLAQLSRFQGELRQEKSQLVRETELLSQQVKTLTAELQTQRSAQLALRQELESLRAAQQRLEADKRAVEQKLEEQLNVPAPVRQIGCTIGAAKWCRVFSDYRREVKQPPAPLKLVVADMHGLKCTAVKSGLDISSNPVIGLLFDMAEFVPNMTDEEFTNLGRFIFLTQSYSAFNLLAFTNGGGGDQSGIFVDGQAPTAELEVWRDWQQQHWEGVARNGSQVLFADNQPCKDPAVKMLECLIAPYEVSRSILMAMLRDDVDIYRILPLGANLLDHPYYPLPRKLASWFRSKLSSD